MHSLLSMGIMAKTTKGKRVQVENTYKAGSTPTATQHGAVQMLVYSFNEVQSFNN